jgi:hypothetical protein
MEDPRTGRELCNGSTLKKKSVRIQDIKKQTLNIYFAGFIYKYIPSPGMPGRRFFYETQSKRDCRVKKNYRIDS